MSSAAKSALPKLAIQPVRTTAAPSASTSPPSSSSSTIRSRSPSPGRGTSLMLSLSDSPTSPRPLTTNARVQLVPHARSPSFDTLLSPEEEEIVRTTSFNPADVSAQDFDFDELFTYDKPQEKLSRVMEVSLPSHSTTPRAPLRREKHDFSFSHYSHGGNLNWKGKRVRIGGLSELYVRNQMQARRH